LIFDLTGDFILPCLIYLSPFIFSLSPKKFLVLSSNSKEAKKKEEGTRNQKRDRTS
jgi:hypothetical protein